MSGKRDFYPRSPCGERHETTPYRVVETQISIHALLAESDYLVRGQRPNWRISIHALLAESDRARPIASNATTKFLSTLSLRRATFQLLHQVRHMQFLSTLSLRRATNTFFIKKDRQINFYPRSPCGERQTLVILPKQLDDFYPRSPCGERPSSCTC